MIFDLDDTLYDYESLEGEARNVVQEYVTSEWKINKKEFEEAFWRGREAVKKQLPETASGHNRLLYYQKTLEELNYMPISDALKLEELYWGWLLEHMQLNESVEKLLNYLKEQGWKIGICTDLTAQIQLRKLKKLGLEKWVDCIVTSEEVGKEKPGIEMFELIRKKMNLEKNEVLYVGDSYKRDIEGASKAGLQAIWFTKGQQKQENVRCVFNFEELLGEIKNGTFKD